MSDSSFERVLALTGIPALANLHPDDLASLAQHADERRVEPGEICTPEDDAVLCLLLSGGLARGPARVPVEAPDLVGVVETLAGASLALRAGREGAHVFTLDRDSLDWVLSDVYELLVAMLRHVSGRWLTAEHPTVEPARTRPSPSYESPMPLVTRMRLLSASEPFASLRAHALGRIASELAPLAVPTGAPLWEPGARCEDCFVVVEGHFIAGGSGEARRLACDPGTVLGLGESLARVARSTGVASASEARVLRLSSEVLIDELEDDPEAAIALLSALSRRVLRAETAPTRTQP